MSDWTPIIVAGIGGSGVVGAIAAILRLPSDREGVAITGSATAVKTMQGVNDELEAAWKRALARGDYWMAAALMAENLLRVHGIDPPNRPGPPD